MVKYIVDKEKKYFDELLLHLRAHNKSFTGEKLSEKNYIYVVKNDVLLGGASTNLSWDWVGIGDLFYTDELVLKELVAKACTLYKEKAVGLKVYTKDIEVHNQLTELGFNNLGTMKMSELRGTTYCSDLLNMNLDQTNHFHTISSKDIINEYDIIVKKEVKKYKEKYHIKDATETMHYAALVDDKFAGGVFLELYEDSMYVDLLAVNKEYRNLDIGTNLMEYAEKVAKEKELKSIDLGTTEFQARTFYEKLGYKVVFTKENYPKGYKCFTLIKHLNKE